MHWILWIAFCSLALSILVVAHGLWLQENIEDARWDTVRVMDKFFKSRQGK